jgi:NTE family protein
MSVTTAADGSIRPRIGICLSGGGFRATLFGLGVVRYLVEAGHARDIQALSAVSGGSVAAAALAEGWPRVLASPSPEAVAEVVAAPLVEVISTKNLRTRGLARFVGARLRPGGRYGSARGRTMAGHLLDTRWLAELPRDLQVVITSTDLTTGRAFRMSQEFIGSWDHGYAPTPPRLSTATALAASTAVPMIFPPVHINTDGLALKTTTREMSLMDGGVYDNLGLEWFQGWSSGRPDAARACDLIIAVDASGPLLRQDRRFGWGKSVWRSKNIQYQQSRAARIRWWVDSLLAGKLRGLHVPIDRDPAAFQPPPGIQSISGAADGALPAGFADLLKRVRTDLDIFSPIECELLQYHGYWATHVRMRHLFPEMAVPAPRWTAYADRDDAVYATLRAQLSGSDAFRLRRRCQAS